MPKFVILFGGRDSTDENCKNVEIEADSLRKAMEQFEKEHLNVRESPRAALSDLGWGPERPGFKKGRKPLFIDLGGGVWFAFPDNNSFRFAIKGCGDWWGCARFVVICRDDNPATHAAISEAAGALPLASLARPVQSETHRQVKRHLGLA